MFANRSAVRMTTAGDGVDTEGGVKGGDTTGAEVAGVGGLDRTESSEGGAIEDISHRINYMTTEKPLCLNIPQTSK